MNADPPTTDPAKPAYRADAAFRSPRAWALLLAVTLAGLLVDLATKYAAFRHVAPTPVEVSRDRVLEVGPRAPLDLLIPPHPPVVVVPYLLEFKLVLNKGAVFGMGAGKRMFFIAFTAVSVGFCLYMFAAWTTRRDRWAHAALGLVLAGGLGNLYDRVVYACVRDFIHPFPNVMLPMGLEWPWGGREVWSYVSNVADKFLLVGIAILMVFLWRAGGSPAQPRAEGAAP